jgi:large subunit ribosomal protein L15
MRTIYITFRFKNNYSYVNLNTIQRMIDQGRIDNSQKITQKTLIESKAVRHAKEGIKILAKGAEYFKAPIDIEVAQASQGAIKAIEKAGGRIVSSYYNRLGLRVLLKPEKWTEKSLPLPRRARPNPKMMPYYTNFKNRGYLSTEMQLIEAKLVDLEKAKQHGEISKAAVSI